MNLKNLPLLEARRIARAQTGDPTALGELYETYRLKVYQYLYYRVGDAQTADDLTSEVFLRMIRSIQSYQVQETSFQAWLFRVAHNLLTDHYRKTNRREITPLEEFSMEAPDPTQPQGMEHHLNHLLLQQALKRLNNEQRDVILLRFVAGMPISDVAQSLQKSEDAIKGLQRRALMALRDVLTEWELSYA